MDETPFSVRTEELRGVPVIKVEGELCLNSKDQFDSALQKAKQRATERSDSPLVVVDFSDLGFVDTEGFKVLLAHMDEIDQQNGEMRLAVDHNGPAHVLLDASNKEGMFPLYRSAEDAVEGKEPKGWYVGA